ncbi:HepT-like ribonuclease domain-containing protein [Desulfobacter sp.]
MRDRLIHDCFGVDYTIVWNVASSKLPDLRIIVQKV